MSRLQWTVGLLLDNDEQLAGGAVTRTWLSLGSGDPLLVTGQGRTPDEALEALRSQADARLTASAELERLISELLP